jgi:lambda family phage tail tape measure protein
MTQRNLSVRLALEGGQQVKRELQDVGATGQRALARVRDASQPASKGLLAVDAASREVQASLNRFAGQLGPVGRGLTALGPAGLAAGAAIGGVVLALRQGLDAAAEAEQRMFRLEGVLRATGHASGLTARELEQFAIGLDRSTLAAKNDVIEAAGALATFRSISGETFKDTLRLAQDLAAVFGGDLRGQAQLLGRALEDPIQGLTALRRVGVSFTQSQREAIAAMAETGDVAAAQRAILAELERQVGGAGAAEAKGLKGAVDGLSLAWRLMLEEIGRTPVVTGLASGAIDLVRRSLEGWTRILGGGPIAEQIVATNRALLEAEARLESLRTAGSDRLLHALEAQVQRLRQELDTLLAQASAEAEVFAEERREAEAGQRAAQAERIAEVIAGIERKLQQQLYELTVDRVQKVRDEEAKTIRELEELRAQGGDPARLEQLMAERRELARRQIEDIERPAREAEARRAEAARAQAGARVAANERVAQNLARELELITSLQGVERERARFVEQAVGRLADPTPARVREVERLAAALFDEARAQEEAARAREQQARMVEDITRQWRTLSDAQDGAVAALERWRAETLGSLDAAASGYDDFARQVEAIFQARLPAAREADLRASTHWRDGAIRALEDYIASANDSAAATEQAFVRGFGRAEDALVSFVTTGRLELKSLADSVLADLTRMAVRQSITAPLAGLLQGAFTSGGLFGLFHGGGVVGERPPAVRYAESGIFHHAPRFHAGGLVGRPGLRPDEVPIIARRGEEVLTRTDPRHRDNREPGARTINVTMTVVTRDADSFRRSQGQITAEVAQLLRRAERNL